jgi:hypothetical protein
MLLVLDSSRNWLQRAGEGTFDLQDEVSVVTESIRLPLDALDLLLMPSSRPVLIG